MAAEAMEGKSPLELLAMGSKAYWARHYSDAAAYLSKSSEMLVEEHKDDKHNSLGNVYLYYGKSLLELAREDGDPLGDAVPKEVGVEDEDVSDEEEEKVEGEELGTKAEAKTEKKEDANISMNGEAVNGDDSKVEDADESKVEEGDESTVEEGDESKVEEGDESKVEDDDGDGEEVAEDATAEEGISGDKEDEEPTDLQLAWEVLELGKIILERRGDEGRQDFADCLVTLGEVSLESENFDSAIADIAAGLEIQKVIYTESKDMRKLAETYYKLGMAMSAHNKIDEGIENYKTTLDILKDRLKVLEAIESPGSSDNEEIKDIKNLIPELEDKISDLNNYKEEINKKPEEEPPATISSPDKKANNISHLVKRKRKLEDVVEETSANAAKKSQ